MKPLASLNALSRRQVVIILLTGFVVSIVIGALGYAAGAFTRLDNLFLDGLVRYSITDGQKHEATVIDIDDVSLSAIGQWPWPRYRLAQLVERLAAHDPAAIGLDVLFPDADRTSLLNIQQSLKRDFGVDMAFTGVPDGLLDNDGYFGDQIGRAGVVGANYFYFDHVNRVDVSFDHGLSFGGRTELLMLPLARGVLVNTGKIASQTRTTGFVNQQPDADGTLRRLPLLIRHDGVTYASLALATAMRSLGVTKGTIETDVNGLSIRVGEHRVPIDAKGRATLRFSGNGDTYDTIPAIDILNGKVRDADLRGKVVFVGSSAVGLHDVHSTAVDPRFPGLKIHALMAESILNDTFVATPSWAPDANMVECLVVGGLMAALFIATSSVHLALVGSLLLGGASILTSVVHYARGGHFVSPAAPIAVVATLFVVFFLMRFAIEKRRSHVWQKRLENARQVTMESMAAVAETRDPETGAHIKRTQHYVRAVAEQLVRAGHHTETLTKDYIDLLFLSAPLHDIGKVGVPDHILLKPGKLTASEFEVMKQHAEFGRKIIFSTSQKIDGDNFLVIAGEIAATHHEKWDGTGYPNGLAGEAIPLAGRIMAVADVYDALVSRRCYKEPFSHAVATSILRDGDGVAFDPLVLAAFFAVEATIESIAALHGEEDPAPMLTGHGSNADARSLDGVTTAAG